MDEMDLLGRAKLYMDKLAQGIDPISGRELPGDEILNNVRLSRCFFYVSEVLEKVIANGGQVGRIKRKQTVALTAEQRERVALSEQPVSLTSLLRAIAEATGQRASSRPVFDGLVHLGLLETAAGEDGKPTRVPTEQGKALGIERIQGYSVERGAYWLNRFTREAQQFVLDNLEGILESGQMEKAGVSNGEEPA